MTSKITHSSGRRRGQRGMTLVELLVAMVIGLIVVLAVTSIVTFGEAQKRTTVSTNDMGQTGAFSTYVLDRAVRSAGSGFAQSWNLGVFGCRLSAMRGGTTILPRNGAFPGAFSNVLAGAQANLRVAPVLIAKGQSSSGSDVLILMGGNAAAGDVPRPLRNPGALANNELRLDNIIGLAQSDLALISQPGVADCLIEQVGTPVAANPEVLPLASTYYNPTDPYSTFRTSDAANPAYLTPLGNAAATNVQFQMFGVGDNRTLFSYDFLRQTGGGTDAEATTAIAEGVVAMRALYGVDTDNNGTFDTWVNPVVGSNFDLNTVMTTPARARQVVAIRVALVLRGSNFERDNVSPAALTLFADLPTALQQTVNLNGVDDQRYRYRVVDTVIPVRNVLMLP